MPAHPLLKGWATSGNDTVPLDQVERYIFGVEMGIGTPVVNGTLMVLNDNNNLFINGVSCTTCQPMGYFYDPALSSSHINCKPPDRSFQLFGFVANTEEAFETICLWGQESTGLCQTV